VDLIGAQPSDGCELDEEIVGGEFVIAGCGAPALLDLVEEPFDQITHPIQISGQERKAYARCELFSCVDGPRLARDF
jgi:hypothetical protein